MKRHARRAYTALKAIGAPVLDPDLGWGGHFAISGEQYGHDDGFYEGHKDYADDGMEWADYYSEDYQEVYSEFGVHKQIMRILGDNDLYAEWNNPGVLAVFDI